MNIIQHRVNSSIELKNISLEYGVEIDIRSNDKELYLHHDPFKNGEKLEDWMINYRHKLLVLNVKEEGLENEVIKMLDNFNVTNFFFLDQSFPFLYKTSKVNNEERCAIRFSDFESIDTVKKFSSFVNWIWVDMFENFPLNDKKINAYLLETGLNICFVSPELHDVHSRNLIKEFRSKVEAMGFGDHYVCTKYPELWI